ncbi:MAG: DUF2079 domain-containing protein [Sandaracinaceae bacterium]|nr:DUF2079 domain-containing protein [Sandaracinaceae bacterium]
MDSRTMALSYSAHPPLASHDDLSRYEKLILWVLMAAFALTLFVFAFLRAFTFHNRNFDLAFYVRMAWGILRGDGWQPLVNAHIAGLHWVWPLLILAPLGAAFGYIPVLLLAQSLSVAWAAWPIARISIFCLGGYNQKMRLLAPWIGAGIWMLQPNLWHVATNEFHPGTLALFPLAWLCESLLRLDCKGFAWASLASVACREDLSLVVGVAALLFTVRSQYLALRVALSVFGLALAYFLLFLLTHAFMAPPKGSFFLHYGHLGEGPAAAVAKAVTEPSFLVQHLLSKDRLVYPFVITAPFGLFTWFSPTWVLCASPVLLMNLFSQFPTTLFLDSHYLTPALPFLCTGAIDGVAKIHGCLERLHLRGSPVSIAGALLVIAGVAHWLCGASPLSRRFDRLAFRDHPLSQALREALALVPPTASIQAPERALAHLATRTKVHRLPPPEAKADFVLFDAWHRRKYAHQEVLLRTAEESLVRAWLARPDHALRWAKSHVYLLERGLPWSHDIGRKRHVIGKTSISFGRYLTSCLGLKRVRMEKKELVLFLVARSECPPDLALRIGWGYRPGRVDLITQGVLSPAKFQVGDLIRSAHPLKPEEVRMWCLRGLRIGAIRESGARPAPEDPVAVDISQEEWLSGDGQGCMVRFFVPLP